MMKTESFGRGLDTGEGVGSRLGPVERALLLLLFQEEERRSGSSPRRAVRQGGAPGQGRLGLTSGDDQGTGYAEVVCLPSHDPRQGENTGEESMR
jgi:hypothetical protein